MTSLKIKENSSICFYEQNAIETNLEWLDKKDNNDNIYIFNYAHASHDYDASTGIPALRSGIKFTITNITYNFNTANPMSDSAKNAARDVFQHLEDLTGNVTFTEINSTNANINFYMRDLAPGIAGQASYPYGNTSWVTIDTSYRNDSFDKGYFEYKLMLHEIGHAIGLEHPHEGIRLPSAEDNQNSSVMSYNSSNSSSVGGAITTRGGPKAAWGFQIYDIAEIQYLYGVGNDYNNGDDIYGYDGLNHHVHTLWDGGGTDTIDASQYNGDASITLLEGLEHVTHIGKVKIWNAFGAHIENATGGNGNDELYGNELDNLLKGGMGNDSYYFTLAGFGNDTIDDANNDGSIYLGGTLLSTTALWTGGNMYEMIVGGITYIVTKFADDLQIAVANAVDDIITILNFTDGAFGITLEQEPANSAPTDITIDNLEITEEIDGAIIGNITVADLNQNDTHTLSVSDNRFEVINGQLKLKDGESIDYENETSVNITITAEDQGGLTYSEDFTIDIIDDTSDNTSTINGDDANNTLVGSNFHDTINGFAGNDLLFGGAGNDELYGDVGNDILLGGQDDDLLSGGSGFDFLIGGNGNDDLQGSDGGDLLVGGEGNDHLTGGMGADILIGGNGIDRFIYNFDNESTSIQTDTIRSFIKGDDLIDLQALVTDGSINSFSDIDISDNGTNTFVSANNGSNFEVKLTGIINLDSSDFIF